MNNEVSLPVGKSQKKMSRKRKTCTESASTEKVKDVNDMQNISKASSGVENGRQGISLTKKSSRKPGKLPDLADVCAVETSKEKKTLDIHERPQKLRRVCSR